MYCWMYASFSLGERKLDSVKLGVEGSPHALTQLGLPVATHHSIDNIHFQTIRYH